LARCPPSAASSELWWLVYEILLPGMDLLGEFVKKHGIDERGARTLNRCTPDIQLQVVTSFAPKVGIFFEDSTKQLLTLIRSIVGADGYALVDEEGGAAAGDDLSLKRKREEALLELGAEVGSEEELALFRHRYPMDDRAYDFLSNSPVSVRAQVMHQFRPRNPNDTDFSSLVTSLVRKARLTFEAEGGVIQAAPASGAFVGGLDPASIQLEAFRQRYPMDERAWDFLSNSSFATQARIVAEFNPRNQGDSDYSAPITAFVKALRNREMPQAASPAVKLQPGPRPPTEEDMEMFRLKFPVDERAWDFLTGSPPAVQHEVLNNFAPRYINDSDYSRPLTSYIKQAQDRVRASGMGNLLQPAVSSRSFVPGQDFGRRSSASSRPGGSGWLAGFRTCYPMDDRAFDFLEQSSAEVQEAVVLEFRPRRAGEDDYSAAITSFVRKVRTRFEASGWVPERWRADAAPPALLEGFKQRYPMDERAWDFLTTSSGNIQRAVLETFRPKREGEADYSRLITSFIRGQRA